jgi:hypothetical protein
MKTSVKEGEAVVAGEAQQAEQLIERLKASVAQLEAKLAETRETMQRNDLSRQQMEESFSAEIHDLQNNLKKNDEVLASRGSDISDLKSKLDGQMKQIGELEMAVEKAKQEAASHAKRAEHLAESSRTRIAVLESQLREKEEFASQKESTVKDLEQKLNAQIEEFESLVQDKEALLAGRNAVIDDLKSQLNVLTKGIGQMSSFFKQAEALAGVGGQEVGTAVPNRPVDEKEETPLSAEANAVKVPTIAPAAAPEITSPEIFERIASELAEASGVMNILASLMVRQHVLALGESMDSFPKTRLPELLERVTKEISDENRQIDFRERLAQNGEIKLI